MSMVYTVPDDYPTREELDWLRTQARCGEPICWGSCCKEKMARLNDIINRLEGLS